MKWERTGHQRWTAQDFEICKRRGEFHTRGWGPRSQHDLSIWREHAPGQWVCIDTARGVQDAKKTAEKHAKNATARPGIGQAANSINQTANPADWGSASDESLRQK